MSLSTNLGKLSNFHQRIEKESKEDRFLFTIHYNQLQLNKILFN